jgi:4-hydroxybenzoate polyprenyltransferase
MKNKSPHVIWLLFKAARPKQWIKNGLILAPLFFSGNIVSLDKVVSALLAALAFCLASSAIYLVNDSIDRPSDRLHPLKCQRPIAAGSLSIAVAGRSASVLAGVAFLIAYWINLETGSLILLYALTSLIYCLILKRIVFLDVITLSLGFVLRAMTGASAISVTVSPWLFACTFCLAIFLALCKRLYEFKNLGENAAVHRDVLATYSLASLTWGIRLTAGLTLLSYAGYTFFPIYTSANLATVWLPLTWPFVLLGLLRYDWMVYHTDKAGTPTEALLTDWKLMTIVAAWILSLLFLFFKG